MTALNDLPPKQRTIIAPEQGWVAHTLYLVHVAYHSGNPIHEAYFKVGFLHSNGDPAGYSEVWNNNYDGSQSFGRVHFIEVIKELK